MKYSVVKNCLPYVASFCLKGREDRKGPFKKQTKKTLAIKCNFLLVVAVGFLMHQLILGLMNVL